MLVVQTNYPQLQTFLLTMNMPLHPPKLLLDITCPYCYITIILLVLTIILLLYYLSLLLYYYVVFCWANKLEKFQLVLPAAPRYHGR